MERANINNNSELKDHSVENSFPSPIFSFKSTSKNPHWSIDNLIPLRLNLIHNNSDRSKHNKKIKKNVPEIPNPTLITPSTLFKEAKYLHYHNNELHCLNAPDVSSNESDGNNGNGYGKLIYSGLCFISTTPKWLTTLTKTEYKGVGAMQVVESEIITNDFKACWGRRKKAVTKFCNHYEPLYHNRKVSALFLTFTRMDYARLDISDMIDNIKVRFSSYGKPILGFFWNLELKENKKFESGFNIHYHILVITDRFLITEIPDQLKFEDLWGQRTGIGFVHKSVRNYLSKPFFKSQAKLLGHRSYGSSNLNKLK